jgi:hypothetical protein
MLVQAVLLCWRVGAQAHQLQTSVPRHLPTLSEASALLKLSHLCILRALSGLWVTFERLMSENRVRRGMEVESTVDCFDDMG